MKPVPRVLSSVLLLAFGAALMLTCGGCSMTFCLGNRCAVSLEGAATCNPEGGASLTYAPAQDIPSEVKFKVDESDLTPAPVPAPTE